MSPFDRALDALEEAGVAHRIRKPPEDARELDLWLSANDLDAAVRALRPAGFFAFAAPGEGSHRFFLAFDPGAGTWHKLDVKLEGVLERGRLRRRIPLSARRLGPVVAVLGPDGAGKGTLIRGLKEICPVAVGEVYMGRRPRRAAADSSGEERPSLASRILPQSALLLWKAARDMRRLTPAYAKAWRGQVVLCDRHPIEVLAVRPERSKAARRVERFIAGRVIPWPDLILVLDAPADQLLKRKREHPVEVLERWRRGYQDAFVPRGAVVISTAGPRKDSLRAASSAVWEALRARRGW